MRFPVKFFPDVTNFDFMGKRWLGFAISLILIAGTVVSLMTKELNYGIDFTGGVLIELRAREAVDLAALRDKLTGAMDAEISLQTAGDPKDVLLRVQSHGEEDQTQVVASTKSLIGEVLGQEIEYRKIDYVGPQVGREMVEKGLWALGLALIGIMGYLWFRFEWQFGLGGVVALVHDAVVTLGFYSVMGLEFNLTSIAAILTIVGYSINDSVVIYDRARENMRKYKRMALDEILNLSLNETLARTMMTAGTVVLSSVALVVFGGEVLKSFSLAMLFGVIIGTYSSVYISAPILIYTNLRPEVARTGKEAEA
ncbi:MAG: protein translocase subunit SecF [Alphaproteobacteria bacterium]|nr:protein translocase subunit SecF [Alphaproteobacteria bacterium]